MRPPSSISGSESQSATRALFALLALLAAYFCALEAVTRIEFQRINHVWRNIGADYGSAVRLQPAAETGAETILIVGNSYLDLAVNRERLRQQIAPEYSTDYLTLWGTTYLDWYFGLRRLYAEGSRPAIVGVCLSTPQLISDATYGAPFANRLMMEQDLFRVKNSARLDTTMTSNYFFAGLSDWLGHREEIRNWILRKSVPRAELLVEYFKPAPQPLPTADVLVERALARLRVLNALCAAHGSRFFLLIPPSLNPHDASAELQAAAARERILVVLPYQHQELSPSAFLSDGAHLNPRGAALFTERLGPTLLQTLYRN
jgi:hypothetical protein